MAVYLVVGSIIILLGVFLQTKKGFTQNIQSKKTYVITVTVILSLMTGLRSPSVGSDTIGYLDMFSRTGHIDITNILGFSLTQKSPGYTLLEWIVYKIIPSGQVFLLITSAFFFVSLGRFIYRNSDYPIASYLVYYCIFHTFQMSGIRQSMAIAVLMFAYEKIKTREILKFLLLLLIAYLFHKTSLVFIIAYFLFDRKVRYRDGIFLLFIIPFIYRYRLQIYEFIKAFTVYDYFDVLYHSEPINYTIMIFSITLAGILLKDKIFNGNGIANHLINSMMIASVIMPLVALNGALRRIVMYFSIYMILLLPEIIRVISKQDIVLRLILNYIFFAVLAYLLIVPLSGTSYAYSFFWQ